MNTRTTIAERNAIAREKMIQRGLEQLKQPVDMSLSDLIEFTHAVVVFSDYREVTAESLLTRFLLQNVDWSNAGEPENIVQRYQTFKQGGVDIALRDWDNRFEMGR